MKQIIKYQTFYLLNSHLSFSLLTNICISRTKEDEAEEMKLRDELRAVDNQIKKLKKNVNIKENISTYKCIFLLLIFFLLDKITREY